jgi:hypothetical protein
MNVILGLSHQGGTLIEDIQEQGAEENVQTEE